MKFKEWFAENENNIPYDETWSEDYCFIDHDEESFEYVWNAALEHARDEFLQREIDRLRADAPPALESGVSAHKERFYLYHPDARRPYCITALEYLKEMK